MPRNQNIFHFESVTSTNDVCFEKCRLNEETNIIIANQQTQGRGRNSKKWVSPKGNISISIGFISDRPVEALSVKTGLVVARTIKEVFGKNIGIKWPNDLILNKKKIGGILTETENSKDSFINVVGVGLNLQIKAEEGHWGSLNEKLQSQAKDKYHLN